ncbi:PAS domain S-box-containing protein [Stigmatella aurantiaca]|uniref:histidine kinase n=1 Tax=Stigmatella aurantiaca TaxID=41 RepID=A0A1H7FSV3_STIAU|nr:response regulator [Stigmatella aurantiaca]SEK28297.1 PAS domain S-box-containing protein [Stigmatella aurantiaca]
MSDSSTPELAAEAPERSESLKLLLVDDDEVDRLTVRRYLATSGITAELVEATSGLEALECLKEQSFDVILLDFLLPGEDGFWVLREIGKRGTHSPVIVLTGQGDEQTVIELMKAGAADYLSKVKLSAERLEQSLRQAMRLHLAEQQHRALAEVLPQIIWTARPDGRPDYYNRRWYEYSGWGPAQSLEADWSGVLHPEDLPGCLAQWNASVQSGTPFEAESRLRRHVDGTYRWHLIQALPLRNAHGRIIQWLGTGTDIDDQKRAAETLSFLAEASTMLTASLEMSVTLERLSALLIPRLGDWCAVYLQEDDGPIRQALVAHADAAKVPLLRELHRTFPPAVGAGCGYPRVLRTGIAELVPELTGQMIQQALGPVEQLDSSGQLRPSSWIVVPLSAQLRVFGALQVCLAGPGRRYTARDLELVQELARRAEIAIDNARLFEMAKAEHLSAEQANRAKDEFLAAVSHELRTPLMAMLGWTRMLRTGQLPPEKHARALEAVERNTQVQTQLIEDLLDVSRIITGKMRLEARLVNPREFIEAALDAVRHAADAKGVLLHSELAPDTGSISGDTDRLQQMVWNLLSNAIKFTPKGGQVTVRLQRMDASVLIEVEDNGQGIPKGSLSHIFERFWQVDGSSTRKHGGLGLGLAIVRHLTELHGGTIEAFSQGEGKGALFSLKLPLATVPVLQGTPPPVQPPSRVGAPQLLAPDLEGLLVLVVDDEPDARELLTVVLENCRAQVITAASAWEGLERLQRSRPQVVISDIGMPGEDGYSFMRRLRALPVERGGQTPAIALTAFARMEDRTRALLAGFQMHVPKPVEPAELVLVLASLTGRQAQVAKRLGGTLA